jgi:hypothetical protein
VAGSARFAAGRSRHHAIAAVCAVAIPVAIGVTFAFDFRDAGDAPETIIYVNSWPANRSIEETRAAVAANTKIREEGQRSAAAVPGRPKQMSKIGL